VCDVCEVVGNNVMCHVIMPTSLKILHKLFPVENTEIYCEVYKFYLTKMGVFISVWGR